MRGILIFLFMLYDDCVAIVSMRQWPHMGKSLIMVLLTRQNTHPFTLCVCVVCTPPLPSKRFSCLQYRVALWIYRTYQMRSKCAGLRRLTRVFCCCRCMMHACHCTFEFALALWHLATECCGLSARIDIADLNCNVNCIV